MSTWPQISRVFAVTALTAVFASCFYENWLGLVEREPIQSRRNLSEVFILGRLVESRDKGVLSSGALLGIGDVSGYLVNDEVVRNHRLKYADGLDFDHYWVYGSHPGFQGLLYGLFDACTSFPPETNLALMRWAVSLFTGLVLALFCLWTAQEAGWFAALVVAGVVVACTWTTILGGNLFWVLGAFYLPLLGVSCLFRTGGAKGTLSLSTIFAWVYVLVLAKVLLTGFEFITSALLMTSVPLVYYAVLDRWRWRESIQRIGVLALAMLSAVATGLTIVALQIRSLSESHTGALDYLIRAYSRRTTGNETHPAWAVGTVLRKYLRSHAFSLADRIGLEPGLLRDLVNGRISLLILIFAIASIVLLVRFGRVRGARSDRTSIAWIVATWYSILAPLSWLVLFRQHATEHFFLDQIVWEMPFVWYGAALLAQTVLAAKRKSPH